MGNVNEGGTIFGNGGKLYSDAPKDAPVTSSENDTPSVTAFVAPIKERIRAFSLRDVGSTVAELAGVSAVAYGCYQIYPPAGWLAGGIALVALGIAAGVDR